MRGVVRSGMSDRRSSVVGAPFALASARDADEAASWAARCARDVVSPQTAVHVLMPDASGGSWIIWGGRCRSAGGTRMTGNWPAALHHSKSGRSARGQGVGGSRPGANFQMLLPVEGREPQRFAS